MNFLKILDGTLRSPRSIQVDTLEWLRLNWNKYDTFALNLGVGCGKSFIARTIQRAADTHIVTPSNYLINQYRDIYPSTNYLKGMSNYKCDRGLNCHDRMKVLERPACPNCPYKEAKRRAEAGENSFLNPMSYKYVENKSKDVLVFDEAHQLPGMLLGLAGYTFNKRQFTFPEHMSNEVHVIQWIIKEFHKLEMLVDLAAAKDRVNVLEKALRIKNRLEPVYKALMTEPEKYYIKYNQREGTLRVLPLFVPNSITQEFKQAKKIILMSGTLTHRDVNVLGKGRVGWFNPPSPIPIENRPVIYDPYEETVNNTTEPSILAGHILFTLDKYRHNNENTLIHIPYKWQDRLKPFIPKEWITHNKETKITAIERFKEEGGVLLGSGMSEGVDFPYDECRLNLIPMIMRPNIGDAYVSKRMTLRDGREWYDSETMTNTIQRIGRSTRGVDDYSKTIIMDPLFSKVVYRNHHLVDREMLIENIQWTKENKDVI